MDKILKIDAAIKLANELREQDKTIVVAGGCFDILHPGHIAFLEKAKRKGDIIFILLESDKTVRKMKGDNRPIHSQEERALKLKTVHTIDYIILLPSFSKNAQYDKLLLKLKPTIIATTSGDPNRNHKERQARLINATVVDVIQRIPNTSTTKLAKTYNNQYL